MKSIGQDILECTHVAAQYLAAASISLLPKKDDDSHTNFGWDFSRKSLTSRQLNEDGLYLALNYQNYRFEFIRKGRVLASKPLSGSSHKDMIDWFNEVFKDLGLKNKYRYEFHYELHYEHMYDEYVFDYVNPSELKEPAHLRALAYQSLQEIVGDQDEVRTWPHHFDTGSLIWIDGDKSIGVGLAIPDDMVDEPYFYVSGWNGDQMVDVKNLKPLLNGMWLNDAWKGGVLRAINASHGDVLSFFKDSIEQLKTTLAR